MIPIEAGNQSLDASNDNNNNVLKYAPNFDKLLIIVKLE